MKILHIINSFMRGGGAETLVLTLATALSKDRRQYCSCIKLERSGRQGVCSVFGRTRRKMLCII